LERISFRAKAEYKSVIKRANVSDKFDSKLYEMALRGPYGLETGLNKLSGTVFFRGRNPSYAFAIERSPDGKQTSLQFVEKLGVDPTIDAQVAGIEETPRAIALGAFYLWTESLPNLIESDTFSITRVHAVRIDDKELVRVEFEYLANDLLGRPDYSVSNGYLVCDPEREWVLTEYGGNFYRFSNDATTEQNAILEHGDRVGELPIATVITRTTKSLKSDYVCESVMSIDIIGRDVPEEEFYLSYYGLPEPNFQQNWFGTWGWYLIGGIGCIVVGAIMIRWRNSRR
jgi:hypothetical protein